MNRVLALLDRPSPQSFGMIPIVFDSGGALKVTGLAAPSAHRGQLMTASSLAELIDSGHALPVGDDAVVDEVPENAVALWLGHRFQEAAEDLRLGPPPLPANEHIVPDATFFVGSPSKMLVYLERWNARAFDRFGKEDDAEQRSRIASLMRWTLPGAPLTLVASWKAAKEPERELDWQLQTFGRGLTPAAWKAKLEAVLRSHVNPFANVRKMVVFTGGTGTHREEVARAFAERLRRKTTVDFGNFTDVIAAELAALPSDKVSRKRLLMTMGQKAVEQSPLALTLTVLKPELLKTPRIVVVDSVRHSSIMEVLNWLVDPERLTVIAVDAAKEVQRQRMKEKGDPDEIAKHPTEAEIPRLAAKAHRHIDGEGQWQEDVAGLVQQVAAG